MIKITTIGAALALALFACPAFAQGHSTHPAPGKPMPGHPMPAHPMPAHPMPGHTMSGNSMPKPGDSPATAALKAANAKMHQEMDISYSGDVDVDFVKGMIPHHAGAVDMAKIILAFGKDPELRKLAEEIVGAQEKEIAFMREWLKKKGQ